jgi:RNA polymerase sigma factor (TIGR02999 family)
VDPGPGEITQVLRRWEQGEPAALETLAPLIYDQLREIAESCLRGERPDHTLQATAVANEVFAGLIEVRRLAFHDRAHFFAFAARLSRRILIDYARKTRAEKRAGAWRRIPLEAELAWLGEARAESLDLSRALDELGELDAEKTRIVELHYFLGCSVEEIAGLLDVSKRTIERSLRFSLVFLRRRLAIA